uniref:Uncharacterized protein n=1 Tax=Parascaris univalens TaxID=6257 RepID=A0A915C771_PARUN
MKTLRNFQSKVTAIYRVQYCFLAGIELLSKFSFSLSCCSFAANKPDGGGCGWIGKGVGEGRHLWKRRKAPYPRNSIADQCTKILPQICFQIYKRICGIRDTFTERLKTLEEEIIAKNAILTDRALQAQLNDRRIDHELQEIERNLFVLQSTAREFLRTAHKYMAEMSIGEIKEQVRGKFI